MRQLGLTGGVLLMAAWLVNGCSPSHGPATSNTTTSAAPDESRGTKPVAEAPPVYTIEATEIESTVGHMFVLRLPENPGTPMRMQTSVEGAECVRLESERHEDRPVANCQACSGYPGVHEFTYRATARGEATLVVREVHVAGRLEPEEKARIALRVR